MPICKKCHQNFPNRIWIEDKKYTINRRKYCITCSPFGKHNTQKIHEINYVKQGCNLICETCNKTYIYKRGFGCSNKRCASCLAIVRQTKRKEKCIEYKGGKCIVCGYKKCHQAMVFHHINPEDKKFNISGNHCLSWNRVKQELDKCILLCNRCHSELHAGIIKLNE